MKRWAFNIIAGVSLALAVLTAGLWVRSYWAADTIMHFTTPRMTTLFNLKGAVGFYRMDFGLGDTRSKWSHEQSSPYGARDTLGAADWELGPVERWNSPPDYIVAIRHWSLLLLFSLPPAAWLLRGPLLRRRRIKRGLCRHCGYDLRATPDRCPECGAAAIQSRQ